MIQDREEFLTRAAMAAEAAFNEHSSDPLHRWNHHRAVAQNCLQIIKAESLEVDNEAILVAAYFHDFERDDRSANNQKVRDFLEQSGCGSDFIDKVINIINEHSFGQTQTSVEAQVLYDGDKLEYLSIERVQAVDPGQLNEAKAVWHERIGRVEKTLHFEASKIEFRQRAQALAYFLSDFPEHQDSVKVLKKLLQ